VPTAWSPPGDTCLAGILRATENRDAHPGCCKAYADLLQGLGRSGRMRSRSRLVALSLIFLGLTACATSPTSELEETLSDQQLLDSLADGSAQLATLGLFSGYSEAWSEGSAVRNLRGLYDTRAWRQLAVDVMRIGSGSDLSWFYLGRAAEELGHPEAALTYYRKSNESAERKGISGCIGATCSGFEFPEDSLARIEVLTQELDRKEQRVGK